MGIREYNPSFVSSATVCFDWRRQKHVVKGIIYHLRHRTGNGVILHYAATDGTALYEPVYSSNQRLWVLKIVDTH